MQALWYHCPFVPPPNEALDVIRELYVGGYATKGQYMLALKFYQEYLDEIKSDKRDKAAALSDVFRYY